MMQFRNVSDAVKAVLANAAAGRYEVIGFQRKTRSADKIHALKTVQVFYSSGDFPKSSGSMGGNRQHDVTMTVLLTVAVSATADLSILDASGSTPAQVSAALVAAQESSSLADDAIEEFIDIIYQILMDAQNQDFGLTNQVANTWISGMQKGDAPREGEYLVLQAKMDLTLRVEETVVGEVGVALLGIDTVIEQDGDTVSKTGINVITT